MHKTRVRIIYVHIAYIRIRALQYIILLFKLIFLNYLYLCEPFFISFQNIYILHTYAYTDLLIIDKFESYI